MSPTLPPQSTPGAIRHRAASILLCIAFLLATLAAKQAIAANPSFPGAVGWGSISTTGGSGGTVYHVTNLNDSGTGSFRDAVAHSGRIVVFDVGGYIRLQSAISASYNLTIAGETAPGGGIGVYGAEVSFTGRSNCIVRHMRFRQGSLDPQGTSTSNSSGNCVGLGSVNNMIFDHCSFEFASYNNVDAVGAVNLTFQNCIFADPIKAQQFNCHFEGGPATFIDCLWVSAHGRSPLAKGDAQYVNNVVYNYGYAFCAGNTSGHFHYDIINNYFIAGPSTTSAGDDYYQVPSGCFNYAAGNLLDSNKDGALNGSADNTTGATVYSTYYFTSSSTVPTASLPTLSPADAFVTVVARAGAFPRDQVDAMVASDVLSLGTSGKIYNTQATDGLSNTGYGIINGGAAVVDSDSDGLPDYWEDAFGANLSPNGTTGALNDGYTNIEEYVNWLATPHYWSQVNVAADIDLAQYMPGFTGVTYAVTSGSNGTVTLNADGHTAHFVPASSTFKGMASFNFTAATSMGTRSDTVSVLVSPDSPSAPPVPVVWQGGTTASGTNVWNNVATNAVWLASTGTIGFAVSDPVTFDDTSINPTVSIAASVSPSSIFISNDTRNYTFSGSGAISGSTNLVKTGAGLLTLGTANTYSGGTTINNSAVAFGTSSAFGAGNISLNDSTIIFPTNGTLGAGSPVVVSGSSAINATSSGANYLSAAVSGTSTDTLALNLGSGTNFTLQSDLSGFLGTLNVTQGTLRINAAAAGSLGGAVVNLGNATVLNHLSTAATAAFGSLTGNTSASVAGSDTGSGTDTYTIGALGQNSTFAGTISNGSAHTLALTKAGAGTLTLSGTSSYTGATTISAGTLYVPGALGATATTVANGATLLLNGSTTGAVTVQLGGTLVGVGTFGGGITAQAGSKVLPGAGSGAEGVLTASNGFSAASTTMVFDLSSSPSGTNDQITIVGGSGSLTGANTFQINAVDGVLGAGTYKLINCGTSVTLGFSGTQTLSGIATSGTRQTFALSRTSSGAAGGYEQLVVTGTAGQLTWMGGTNSNTWDLKSTVNWSGGPSGDNKFYNIDAVTLDDTSANGFITLNGLLQPRSLNVANSSTSYTLSGPGVLTGTGTLTKSGTGTLTIAPSATSVSSTTTSGSATVTVTDASALSVGMTVSGTGIAAGTTISVISGTTLALSQSATASGTVTLNYIAASSFSGGTALNGGTILLSNSVANANGLGTGPITFNGGTLTMAGYPSSTTTTFSTFSNNLVVPTGATGTLNTTPRSSGSAPYAGILGTLTGGGTLNLSVPYIRDGIGGDWSGFTGRLNVTAPSSGNFMLATNYSNPGLPKAAVNLGSGVTMMFSGIISDTGTEIDIGELSGSSGSYLVGGPSSSGGRPFTWGIGGLGTNATFAGTISEQASATTQTSFIKYGAGSWSLTGACNFNGPMIVAAGTLSIANTFLSGDVLNVQSGATLNLAGGSVGADIVRVDAGGTINGSGTIATSLENNGTVVCSSGTLTITGDVANNGTMQITSGASLSVNGTLTNSGVLDLLTAGSQSLPASFVNNGIVIDSSSVKIKTFVKGSSAFTVTVDSYSGHTYKLQSATSLTAPNWQDVTSAQAGTTQSDGTPTTLTFTDASTPSGSRFYRVVVAP